MALVVESTSSVATNNTDNLTITKPTGVQVGELLVIMAMGEHDGNSGFVSQISSTGFTKQLSPAGPDNNSSTDTNRGAVFLWRIADASDVSASNYTISLAGSESLGIAAMFRISGWTSGNPVFSSSTPLALSATSLTLSRPSANLLIMLSGIKEDDRTYSFSGQTITSSGSNPSWTEVVDSSVIVNQSTDTRSISTCIAYANDTDISDITAFSATQTVTGGGSGNPAPISILAVICEPINATADISHLAITPTVESLTGSNTATATIDHIELTPTLESLTATSSSDNTRWTTTPKS